jgi:hypothetical protein
MCNIAMNFVFVLATQICAKELALSSAADVQDTTNKLVEHLSRRMLSARPLRDADVDSTILGKPGHAATVARSHGVSFNRPFTPSDTHMRTGMPQATSFLRGKLAPLSNPSVQRKVQARSEDADFNSNNNKMVVPSDSFGGVSPERKAALHMKRFFTFIAVKIVLHQLEGINRNSYYELKNFYETEPLVDADDWMEKLMTQNKILAVRIMEVRRAAHEDFEWDWMQKITVQELEAGNLKTMRSWAQKTYGNLQPTVASHNNTALL